MEEESDQNLEQNLDQNPEQEQGQNSEPTKIVRFARFLFVWICIGIPLGLYTLTVGPMEWLNRYAHKTAMPAEDVAYYGRLIVLGFVVVSFLVAFLICRVILKCGRRRNRRNSC
ncbi:hypothetical protein [uncultured Acetobacteroides sp.]|uniref:hypothetical protein n=1 Tax=uncultured Acetobacteroides sp. TaxID=1760811 RepID=UPI0029F50B06|nr:hypothetical protein [uncultured Acetobacteroides sp.]